MSRGVTREQMRAIRTAVTFVKEGKTRSYEQWRDEGDATSNLVYAAFNQPVIGETVRSWDQEKFREHLAATTYRIAGVPYPYD